MRIPDDELRVLYEAEAAEHLAAIESGLLALEGPSPAPLTMEALFRAAHSLKGASAMVGLTGIESASHQFEEILAACGRGDSKVTPDLIDRMYCSLDEMRSMAGEAVAVGPSADAVDPTLGTPELAATPRTPTSSEAAPAGTVPGIEAGAPSSGRDGLGAASPAVIADTIRVPASRLDTLVAGAGELAVTRTQLARHRHRLGPIRDHLDAWRRAESRGSRAGVATTSPPTGRAWDALPGSATATGAELLHLFDAVWSDLESDLDRLDAVTEMLDREIRSLRLLALSSLFQVFPRMVRDLAHAGGKEIDLQIEGADTAVDRRILEGIKDPLVHLLRNAVDHGIEPPTVRTAAGKARAATLVLRASQTPSSVVIEVSDDGRGLDLAAIKQRARLSGAASEAALESMPEREVQALIFSPGLTTRERPTEISGRGVGLDIVRKGVEDLNGTLEVISRAEAGCVFRLTVPITLSTERVIRVEISGRQFGVPVASVRRIMAVRPEDRRVLGGEAMLATEDGPIPAVRLQELLSLADPSPSVPGRPAPPAQEVCVQLSVHGASLGLTVNGAVHEQEIVVKPLGAPLRRVRNIAGVAILEDGDLCLVLNPSDLIRTHHRLSKDRSAVGPAAAPEATVGKTAARPLVLLVEDSITVRTHEKRILEAAGFEVVVAVDGLDAWAKLERAAVDAVVTDVAMPNLGGLDLTRRIRADGRFTDLPVILVTSLASDEDRRNGAEAGANAYLPKPAFDARMLVQTIERLL